MTICFQDKLLHVLKAEYNTIQTDEMKPLLFISDSLGTIILMINTLINVINVLSYNYLTWSILGFIYHG